MLTRRPHMLLAQQAEFRTFGWDANLERGRIDRTPMPGRVKLACGGMPGASSSLATLPQPCSPFAHHDAAMAMCAVRLPRRKVDAPAFDLWVGCLGGTSSISAGASKALGASHRVMSHAC